MRASRRRTAPKVRDGQVQRQNNWELHPHDYARRPQDEVRLDRRPPGRGYRHLVTIQQLRTFVELLHEWPRLATGLDAIVLDRGDPNVLGWYRAGVAALCAWPRELWWPTCSRDFVDECGWMLELVGVERGPARNRIELRWTEAQARAFQLAYVLPHELGHHRDRITNRGFIRPARGEPYAEAYARWTVEEMWPAYLRTFGV